MELERNENKTESKFQNILKDKKIGGGGGSCALYSSVYT